MKKPVYSICVKPSARYLICTGNEIWVKDYDTDGYVGIMERGEWKTKEEAMKQIGDPMIEIVAEVFR